MTSNTLNSINAKQFDFREQFLPDLQSWNFLEDQPGLDPTQTKNKTQLTDWLNAQIDAFDFDVEQDFATKFNASNDGPRDIDHWNAPGHGAQLHDNKKHEAWDVYSKGTYTMGDGETVFDNKGSSWHPSGPDRGLYTRINGNDQDNVIYGGNITGMRGDPYAHDDIISGGGGNDIIYGLDGNDKLYGDEGNDVLFGGDGNDYLVGGTGDDMLFGGSGYDELYGGEGNDWLYSGPSGVGQGAEMYGGSGRDTFIVGWAPETQFTEGTKPTWDTGLEMMFGIGSMFVPKLKIALTAVSLIKTISDAFSTSEGSGSVGTAGQSVTKIKDFNPLEDKILIPVDDINNIDVYLSDDSNPNVVMTIKNASGQVIAEISFARAEDIFGPGTSYLNSDVLKIFVEQLKASAMLIGQDGAFYGLDSRHPLNLSHEDLRELGANNFLLLGAYGNQEFAGSAGADTVFGTNYDDIISGYQLDPRGGGSVEHFNPANDVLFGFDGNDLFFGGAGNNTLYGGDGSDTASYQYANRGIVVDMQDTFTDSNGTYYEVLNGHMYRLNKNGEMVEVIGYDKNYSVENVIGSDHDDVISGDGGANVLVTGGGTDVLNGRGGNDTLISTGGHNTLTGGSGADTFIMRGGTSIITDYEGLKGGEKIIVELRHYGHDKPYLGNDPWDFVSVKQYESGGRYFFEMFSDITGELIFRIDDWIPSEGLDFEFVVPKYQPCDDLPPSEWPYEDESCPCSNDRYLEQYSGSEVFDLF
jgi:Ca2+-binding RTX toxin-like protein